MALERRAAMALEKMRFRCGEVRIKYMGIMGLTA